MALIKYSTFQLLLGQVGLHIVHHIPHVDVEEKLILSASIKGKHSEEGPHIINGGNQKPLHINDGKSLGDIIDKLWSMATEHKLFIGTYDNYTHSVEWSRGNNTFIKRPLEEKELLEINSLY